MWRGFNLRVGVLAETLVYSAYAAMIAFVLWWLLLVFSAGPSIPVGLLIFVASLTFVVAAVSWWFMAARQLITKRRALIIGFLVPILVVAISFAFIVAIWTAASIVLGDMQGIRLILFGVMVLLYFVPVFLVFATLGVVATLIFYRWVLPKQRHAPWA